MTFSGRIALFTDTFHSLPTPHTFNPTHTARTSRIMKEVNDSLPLDEPMAKRCMMSPEWQCMYISLWEQSY